MFFVLLGIALAFKVVYQVQAPPKPVDVNTAEIHNLQEIELITQASKDSGIETLSGSITMAGRPYLYSVLGDETKFIYEPWIDSNTVMSAVDSYDVTWRLLADEFGVDKLSLIHI